MLWNRVVCAAAADVQQQGGKEGKGKRKKEGRKVGNKGERKEGREKRKKEGRRRRRKEGSWLVAIIGLFCDYYFYGTQCIF